MRCVCGVARAPVASPSLSPSGAAPPLAPWFRQLPPAPFPNSHKVLENRPEAPVSTFLIPSPTVMFTRLDSPELSRPLPAPLRSPPSLPPFSLNPPPPLLSYPPAIAPYQCTMAASGPGPSPMRIGRRCECMGVGGGVGVGRAGARPKLPLTAAAPAAGASEPVASAGCGL